MLFKLQSLSKTQKLRDFYNKSTLSPLIPLKHKKLTLLGENMKNLTLLSLVMALFLTFSSSVDAQQRKANSGKFFGNDAKGKWLIGLKAAKIDNNLEQIKDANAVGVILGYEFDRPIGSSGGSSTVELEYLNASETDYVGIGTYDPDMLNLFFTYRSAGDLYFKLKLGGSYSSIDIDLPAVNGNSEVFSVAGGIGLGYHIEDYGVVELEYSVDTGDNDLSVLGLNAILEF